MIEKMSAWLIFIVRLSNEGLRGQESSQGVVDSLARSRQVMADQVGRLLPYADYIRVLNC